jgi:NAD(P)-dependent dehydrogenase (short-subunit alcohol dehydrogenase family)
MYPELKGKVAVISGAGGNLGMAVVRRLAAEGMRFALIDLHEDKLRSRLQETGLYDSAMVLGGLDLTVKADVDSFVARANEAFGALDVLVNVAGGFAFGGPVHEMGEEVWDRMFDLNAKTAYLLSAAAARIMVGRGNGGRIINISSRSALVGGGSISAYSASKAALLRLTESMSGELIKYGITVNAIMPSVIDTPQNRQSDPRADFTQWVAPESIADVIAFLASDSSRDISGASIPVYGRA